MKYYAVKVGNNPGIYTDWEECKYQTKGFPGAEYKSFKTIEEAEKYLGYPADNGEQVERNLDGIYCRVKRDGKYTNACFSDMCLEEQNKFLDGLDSSGLVRTLEHLNDQLLSVSKDCLTEAELKAVIRYVAVILKHIGDEYGIVCGKEE